MSYRRWCLVCKVSGKRRPAQPQGLGLALCKKHGGYNITRRKHRARRA